MKKVGFSALFVVGLVSIMVVLHAPGQTPQNSQERLITKILVTQYPFPIPIQITEIKIKNTVIKPGELLDVDPDFLRGLHVTVKNLMNVELQGVGVSIRFPYDNNRQPVISELELIAGNYFEFQDHATVDFHLAPGESIELNVNDAYYAAFLEDVKNNPRAKLHTLNIIPMMAGFDEDNVWSDGDYKIRDPQNSKHWRKKEAAPPKRISRFDK